MLHNGGQEIKQKCFTIFTKQGFFKQSQVGDKRLPA